MPLVRISHPSGQAAAYRQAISAGVHDAMVATFGVSEDDRFQVVSEHAPATELVHPPSFRGVTFSDGMLVIQITCAEGRTVEQKRALYAGIAERLSADPGLRLRTWS